MHSDATPSCDQRGDESIGRRYRRDFGISRGMAYTGREATLKFQIASALASGFEASRTAIFTSSTSDLARILSSTLPLCAFGVISLMPVARPTFLLKLRRTTSDALLGNLQPSSRIGGTRDGKGEGCAGTIVRHGPQTTSVAFAD